VAADARDGEVAVTALRQRERWFMGFEEDIVYGSNGFKPYEYCQLLAN
jgi:hypothetical protein